MRFELHSYDSGAPWSRAVGVGVGCDSLSFSGSGDFLRPMEGQKEGWI